MPYVANTSLLPRYCPIFQCEPNPPRVFYRRPNGAMLDPAELPRSASQVSPHKTVPDVINMAGCWCVSQPFRDLVEEREPGVHAFYPLPLFRKDGSAVEQHYHLFDVRQQIDAVDLDRSEVAWTEATAGRRLMSVGDYSKLALDSQAIAGKHVWRGHQQLSNIVFCSDDIMAAIERAKLKKLRFDRTRPS